MTKKSTMSKILIVEDDPDIRELLRFNLEKAGYNLSWRRMGKRPSPWRANIPRISFSWT